MPFLLSTDAYSAEKAAELCKQYMMYKEEAYLQNKLGNKEEAVRVLIDECPNVSEVIQLAVKFHINDDLLWDEILLKAVGKTKKVN